MLKSIIDIAKAIKYYSKACELKYDSGSCYNSNELKKKQANDLNATTANQKGTK